MTQTLLSLLALAILLLAQRENLRSQNEIAKLRRDANARWNRHNRHRPLK